MFYDRQTDRVPLKRRGQNHQHIEQNKNIQSYNVGTSATIAILQHSGNRKEQSVHMMLNGKNKGCEINQNHD